MFVSLVIFIITDATELYLLRNISLLEFAF